MSSNVEYRVKVVRLDVRQLVRLLPQWRLLLRKRRRNCIVLEHLHRPRVERRLAALGRRDHQLRLVFQFLPWMRKLGLCSVNQSACCMRILNSESCVSSVAVLTKYHPVAALFAGIFSCEVSTMSTLGAISSDSFLVNPLIRELGTADSYIPRDPPPINHDVMNNHILAMPSSDQDERMWHRHLDVGSPHLELENKYWSTCGGPPF